MIHEITIEQELNLVEKFPKKRFGLNLPKTILVKIVEYTANQNVDFGVPTSPNYRVGYWPKYAGTVHALICGISGNVNDPEGPVQIVEGHASRKITVHNFRPSVAPSNDYFLAHLVGDCYVIDNHFCLEEFL